MKKRIAIIPLLILMMSCSSPKTEQNDAENELKQEVVDKSTPVKAMRLSVHDFSNDLIANGIISSQRVAELKFMSSEKIVRIYVKNGDRVMKGQKIAELDRFKLKNSALQAKDNLERAKLELQDVLIGQGYNLKDSLKIPAEVMKIAHVKSNYDQGLISYDMAEYNLKNAVLYAPFDGVVANLFSKEYNQALSSEAFCSIIDNKHPEVEFKILENELALIGKGDRVKVSPYSLTNFTADGKITEVNPLVDKNGMVYIKAILTSSAKLIDGMNVRVLIQQHVTNQLVIPKDALVLRTGKKVVFTLKAGKAYWNYVSTGLENSTGYVVTQGLQTGDSVIYDGNINLAHESPVTVMK